MYTVLDMLMYFQSHGGSDGTVPHLQMSDYRVIGQEKLKLCLILICLFLLLLQVWTGHPKILNSAHFDPESDHCLAVIA